MKSAALFSSILTLLLAASGWAQQISTTLTLQRVVDRYIEQNLQLQAARYRLERTHADQIAAHLRLNPGLYVTAENIAVSGPSPFGRLYELGISYTETIELGGKRDLRTKVADAAVAVAEAQLLDCDHNEAGIARAEVDQKIAETQRDLVRKHALAEVEAAYAAFQTAREQVQTFRNELLNQAEESRSIALAAYQEGATALLPVLEAQRTRAEVQRQYFQTLFDYHVSLGELELAVGKELEP